MSRLKPGHRGLYKETNGEDLCKSAEAAPDCRWLDAGSRAVLPSDFRRLSSLLSTVTGRWEVRGLFHISPGRIAASRSWLWWLSFPTGPTCFSSYQIRLGGGV